MNMRIPLKRWATQSEQVHQITCHDALAFRQDGRHEVVEVSFRVGLELQRVVGVGVLDDGTVGDRQVADEPAGAFVVDDTIAAGEEQSQRHRRRPSPVGADLPVQSARRQKKPGGDLPNRQGIVPDEVDPVRRGGKQLRVVQRDVEASSGPTLR